MSSILFCMTVVLTVLPLAVSQCTTSRCAERGYEPPRWENGALYLETLLSETSKTLLKALETRLTEHSEAVGLRLAAQSEAMETRLSEAIDDRFATMTASLEVALNSQMDAIEENKENGTKYIASEIQEARKESVKAIDDRFASLKEALNSQINAFEESKENGTKHIASRIQRLAQQTTGIETRSAEQSETINELAKAIDDRFASLEETLNTRMDGIEESNANGTNDLTAKMQEQSTALGTHLAQQGVSISAHLTRTIDKKYKTLTETLEETIRNGTCALVPKMQDLAEQSMAVETRLTELEGVIKSRTIVGRCENLTETLEEVTDRLNRRVDDLQERLVTEMRKLGNIVAERLTNETQKALAVTEHGLKDGHLPPNISVPDLVHSTKSSAISDSEETHEPTTESYTTLGDPVSEFLPGQPIVFLRRMDGSVNFTRPWADYKAGFGVRGGEFWLGLDTLHSLTTLSHYKLRVELTDWSGERKWEVHNLFSVGGENDNYRLSVSGYDSSVSTTQYDALQINNGKQFSTIDNDNDGSSSVNCANRDKGGWWYQACGSHVNPTGEYRPAGYTGYRGGDGGIMWHGAYRDWRPFKELTLKLIPV